jgi:hypothetical protein
MAHSGAQVKSLNAMVVDLKRQQLKLSYVDERKKAWTFTLCSWNAPSGCRILLLLCPMRMPMRHGTPPVHRCSARSSPTQKMQCPPRQLSFCRKVLDCEPKSRIGQKPTHGNPNPTSLVGAPAAQVHSRPTQAVQVAPLDGAQSCSGRQYSSRDKTNSASVFRKSGPDPGGGKVAGDKDEVGARAQATPLAVSPAHSTSKRIQRVM